MPQATNNITIDFGRPGQLDRPSVALTQLPIDPDFFKAYGMRLIAGRELSRDRAEDRIPADDPSLASARGIVATPNSGEFERVFHGAASASFDDRCATAEAAARDRHATLVVKGSPDILTDGESTVANLHHHLAMTVGGVGDVLGGVLGSLLAQGVRPLHAARLATYWTGEAGLRAAAHRGFGTVATDLLDDLPAALVAGLQRVERTV